MQINNILLHLPVLLVLHLRASACLAYFLCNVFCCASACVACTSARVETNLKCVAHCFSKWILVLFKLKYSCSTKMSFMKSHCFEEVKVFSGYQFLTSARVAPPGYEIFSLFWFCHSSMFFLKALSNHAFENFDNPVCSEVYLAIILKLLTRETNDIVIRNYTVVFNIEYCWISKRVVFQNRTNPWTKICASFTRKLTSSFLYYWILWIKFLVSIQFCCTSDVYNMKVGQYCFAVLYLQENCILQQ